METDYWNNFWTALGVFSSLGVSSVAIWISFKANKQTDKQIKINSKQHLFEEKVNLYIEIEKCFIVYKKYKDKLDKEKNEFAINSQAIFIAIDQFDLDFGSLLEGKSEGYEKVSSRIDSLTLVLKKIKFIFSDRKCKNLYNFLNSYIEIHKNLNLFRVAINTIEQMSDDPKTKRTLEYHTAKKLQKSSKDKLFKELASADKYFTLVESEETLSYIEDGIKL